MIGQIRRLSTLAVAFFLVAAVAGAGAVAGIAGAQQTTEINSCTTITDPGEYVLTNDVENADAESCILIEASDVTLDGNSYTVDGTDVDGTRGVDVAEGSNDVAVRDVTVTDWSIGVYSYPERTTVSGVTAKSNFIGLFFEEGSENTVTDTTATNNEGDGMSFFLSGENTLRNVTASANGGNGFSFTDSASDTLRSIEATNNDRAGVAIEESGGNTISDAVVTGNQVGFDFTLVGNTTIENAQVTDNADGAFESDSVLGQDPETNTAENFETDSATISFTEIKDASALNHALRIDAVESAPDDPDGFRNIGQYVEVNESAPNATPSVELDIQYDDSDAEDVGVDEKSLRLYAYADGEWSEVSDSSVDTEANVVSGNLIDFSEENVTVVAPLGQSTDQQQDDEKRNGGSDDDEQERPGDDQQDEQKETNNENAKTEDGDDDRQQTETNSGSDEPKDESSDTDDKEKREEQQEDNDKQENSEDDRTSEGTVFTDPIIVEFAGIMISFGPPADIDGDGTYEDVTGDGSVNIFDAAAHAIVNTLVDQGALDLTDEQTDALDVEGDGDLDYDDSFEIV